MLSVYPFASLRGAPNSCNEFVLTELRAAARGRGTLWREEQFLAVLFLGLRTIQTITESARFGARVVAYALFQTLHGVRVVLLNPFGPVFHPDLR